MTYKPQYFKRWENFEFQTDSKNYNFQIAWWLTQCSQLSYENKITIATELRAANFNHVMFFNASGTQAFLAKHPGVNGKGKFAVLAFRGTEQDSIDILTDVNFVTRLFPNENLLEKPSQEAEAIQKKPKKVEKLYAHGGFLQGIQNVWGSALRQEIQNLYPDAIWQGVPGISEALCELEPGVSLYFTGHSLGGALATLAAYKAIVYQSSVKLLHFTHSVHLELFNVLLLKQLIESCDVHPQNYKKTHDFRIHRGHIKGIKKLPVQKLELATGQPS